ncbi:MAG: hypothetical protein ABWY20_02230 [Mycobacterium sp.]
MSTPADFRISSTPTPFVAVLVDIGWSDGAMHRPTAIARTCDRQYPIAGDRL